MGERGSYASGQEMTRPEVTKHHARASRKTEMGVGCKRAMGKAKSMFKELVGLLLESGRIALRDLDVRPPQRVHDINPKQGNRQSGDQRPR